MIRISCPPPTAATSILPPPSVFRASPLLRLIVHSSPPSESSWKTCDKDQQRVLFQTVFSVLKLSMGCRGPGRRIVRDR
eukprot:1743646-Rhodomonas_salina.2